MTNVTKPLPPIDAEGGVYRERPIAPGRTALLSIDMQNGEVGEPIRRRAREPSSPESGHAAFFERIETVLIPNQRRLLRAAHAAGIEVLFTTIESLTRDGRDRSLDHKISRLHAPKGSWEAKVIDEVGPIGDEIVIPKTASSVFNATNIAYVLRNLGIDSLIVFGVLTDQCVESAIRDAADLGFLVTEIEDACAAYDPDRHARSIRAMAGHYCRVRTTAEMVAEIEALFDGVRARG